MPKTLEQIQQEEAEIAKLDVCCRKCKFYGRAEDGRRHPSGQCQLNPPGKFSVSLVSETAFGKGVFSISSEPIESPFPGVWPWDKCGKFEANASPTLT